MIWQVLLIALLAFGLGLNIGRLLASWQEQTKDRDDNADEIYEEFARRHDIEFGGNCWQPAPEPKKHRPAPPKK